ncbi:MAG: SGNH/GDSL hydrolase family protein [Chitinophagaceae bacterium]|nr:SGNH/GDSL hydrolase family protein [Chitinophagaceae bacterium]
MTVLFTYCSKNETPPINPAVPGNPVTDTATRAEKKYLALGDSYTIGEGVQVRERYPSQLVTQLRQSNVRVADPLFVARTGWTTTDLDKAIIDQNITGTYDLVTLLIGVNDQFQRRDTTGYRSRFRALLQKSILFAADNPARVFVLSIPDYSVTPYGGGSATISQQIEQFNKITKEVTVSYNVTYIDITGLSKEMGTDPTLVADGLHPSGKEYTRWTALLFTAVKRAL